MMLNNERINHKIEAIVETLKGSQRSDGSWKYCFEGSIMTDAFMIITLRSLNVKDEEKLIKQLTDRLLHLQSSEGTWKAYPDEKDGNLSATVQAYCALLYSGYYTQHHTSLKKAELFIKLNGGLSNTHFMTKWMLAVNGLYSWPTFFYVPMTFLLIPASFPLNFYQFSSYARIHFIPMMIAANKKFTITSSHTPNIDHLFDRESNQLDLWNLQPFLRSNLAFADEMKHLMNLPEQLHRIGYQKAERYMLKRIEDDGTLFSYASATFFMIYGLMALGYDQKSPTIIHALQGLKQLVSSNCTGIHLENSTSTVWDTALLSYALQEANVSVQSQMIKKSVDYLLKKQHTQKGDWKFHNPHVPPGGWGFSHNNTLNPDNDDTSVALRALTRQANSNNHVKSSWYKGVTYLLSMQNSDGGWAAFEKNTNLEILTYLPLENAKDAAIDPSTADLTGRTLEFLGKCAGLTKHHPSIKAAIKWLIDNQEEDGSWYGRWGVCYIYGTWAAVTGLQAVGIPPTSSVIKKAINWLESIQLKDGGWGESCLSSKLKKYVPLPYSTPSQTSWALDTLIQCGYFKRESVQKGLTHLIEDESFTLEGRLYPTGIGLPGQFYIHYHSYNLLFPLLTFAHYRKRIQEN